MERLRVALYLLLVALAGLSAIAKDDPSTLSTDWLTPPLKIDEVWFNVCRLEISIDDAQDEPDNETRSGSLVIYAGSPEFNDFGDSDKQILRRREFPVFLREIEPAPGEWGLGGPIDSRGRKLFQLACDELPIDPLQLVVSSVESRESRLLLRSLEEERLARILPLQSTDKAVAAKRRPRSDPRSLDLTSPSGRVRIFGESPNLYYSQDPNHYDYNGLGDRTRTTLMGFGRHAVELEELRKGDPTGKGRRVFRCRLDRDFLGLPGTGGRRDAPALAEERLLVLHPHEGGWHRLLIKQSGKVERLIPLHSARLRSWLEVKEQLSEADPSEQESFRMLTEEIPYFSGFKLKGRHVDAAELHLTRDNQDALRHLVGLPALKSLTVYGDCVSGESLGQLAGLSRLSLSRGSISEEALRGIGKLRQLESIWLSPTRIDCKGLPYLEGLPELKHFAARKGGVGDIAPNYDDSQMAVFKSLPNLESLNLQAFPISDSAIGLLPVSDQLQSVELGARTPFPTVLKYAQRAPHATISFGNERWSLSKGEVVVPSTVSPDDLRALEGVRELDSLRIAYRTDLKDSEIEALLGTKLKRLSLRNGSELTDAGIEKLSQLQSLEYLNLFNCRQITNASIEHFKNLPNLKMVNIKSTRIDPEEFRAALPHIAIED